MIPIDYIGSLKEYNSFIASFRKEIDDVIKRGYIGSRTSMKVSKARSIVKGLKGERRKKFKAAVGFDQKGWEKWSARKEVKAPKKMIEEQTVWLLQYIQVLADKLFEGRTSDLEFCIDCIEQWFPEIKDKRTKLYDDIQTLFVKHGFEHRHFPKDKLVEATETNVCPYCNRVFVQNITLANGGSMKGQLDHFLPKEKFPYLAISKYNLVPSCPFCNSVTLKGSTDPRMEHMVSPYSLKDAHGLKFTNNIRKKGFLNLTTCAQSVKVSVNCQGNPDLKNNARVFHLKDIYNSHTDYVAEMYYRYNMTKSPFYKAFAYQMLNQNAGRGFWRIKLSQAEWDRIVLGVYTDENDFKKRPMSKFCMDMMDDFKRKKL